MDESARWAKPPPVESGRPAGGLRRGVRQAARFLLAASTACSSAAMVVAATGVAVMLAYTTASVLGRYTGWFILLGADQIGGYSLSALFFFGMAPAFRNGAFIRVTILQRKLPLRFRAASENVLYMFALLYVIVLDRYFWQLVSQSKGFGTKTVGAFTWPLYLPQLSLAIGGALLAFQLVALLIGRFLGLVSGWVGEHEDEFA